LQRADLTIRAIAGLIDLLIIIGLAKLPDVIGYASATGYILIRDGLLDHRSIGKKLLGLRIASAEEPGPPASCRESIIRNVPLVAAYFLFLIPYAGWVLGPLALVVEYLTALGDEQGMRIGDLLARTRVVLDAPLSVALQNGADHQPDEGRPTTTGPLDSQQ
jgi:uncharacterized RDD family membrane protein YckC